MENRRSCIDALAMKRHPAKHWRAGALSVTFCAVAASAMATVSYTYENDGKTLVATVSDADTGLSTSAADQAWFTDGLTNFVKRGTPSLNVWENVKNDFTGDIRIEQGHLLFYGNALGVNQAQGEIMIHFGNLVINGNNRTVSIAKDVAFGFGYGDDWNGRTIQVWNGYKGAISGKVTTGNRNAKIVVYKGGTLALTGGIEDPVSGGSGYLYLGAYNGSSMMFSEKPVVMAHGLYFEIQSYHVRDHDAYRDSSGYFGHFTFAVPGNSFPTLGYDNDSSSGNYRFRYHDIKTTVDWAFDRANMTVYLGEDAKWDLCGTSQRVGQFDVKLARGGASVITNSSETAATLHLGMIFTHKSDDPPDVRFGGNLSVVFENNIDTTPINHAMTACGSLVHAGQGTLAFTENGSWANATNVTVSGTGKITVANAGALGQRANVNLASASSLEIASDVTVQVRTLTVGGVQQRRGDYTFGGGTLSVTHPVGFQMGIR